MAFGPRPTAPPKYNIIPILSPPKSPIELSGARIVALPLHATIANEPVGWVGHPWTLAEISQLANERRPRPPGMIGGVMTDEKDVAAFLEVTDERRDPDTYVALITLVTKSWRYLLFRHSAAKAGDETPLTSIRVTKTLRKSLERAAKLVSERRFAVAMKRWGASYLRHDPLDAILDCCSALEAIVASDNELRLRLALSVYHLVPSRKHEAMKLTYRMYGIRNKFAHGSSLPPVSFAELQAYIALVAQVLMQVIQNGRAPSKEWLDEIILA